MTSRAYSDALETALGGVLAEFRRSVELERAQAATALAELRADLAEARTQAAALEARLLAAVSERVETVAAPLIARAAEQPDLTVYATQADLEAVRLAIPEVLAAPDLAGYATKEDVAAVRLAIAEAPAALDLSPYATQADLEAVRLAIPEVPAAPDLASYASKEDVDAVRLAIAEAPAALDLSTYATKDDLEAVRLAIPQAPAAPNLGEFATKAELADAIKALPEAKDWTQDIEAAAAAAAHQLDAQAAATQAKLDRLADRPGTFPVAKAWEDRVHYEGHVVTHEGATYQALRDTGKAPGHEDWVCLAGRGGEGPQGASPRIRGTYADGETYTALDVVILNGSSFIAKADAPGPCPGDGWQLLASRGEKGKATKGDPGADGASITGASITDDGLVTFTTTKGQRVELDLYPVLSQVIR